ncbi:MAG TPA: RdgB/HAM1 family non-canonical purine NTP pyrophosphatase [Fimbriimonadaceae bacterium]|nr:RdgB/HAM1 family non-canonical purine NTP pyrophosphatase [Fimbriimonadaceae bacterium]
MPVLVIATHNVKKAGEMVTILSRRLPDLQIRTLADYPGAPEPDEAGTTYAENATIKAESAARVTGEWSVADDAGLEVDALGGAPGLHSKRFEGEDTPFAEKMCRILERLEGVPESDRTARFRCCVAVAAPGLTEPTRVFEATCEGRIAPAPSGGGGFGYDPIFFLPELGCTMADLTADQKHAISHRGKVLALVGEDLAMRLR